MARILVIDDESDLRHSIADALAEAGHSVIECGTVDEAVPLLRKEAFDVLITDLRMPGKSGIELLREASEKMPDAILIVLTAYASIASVIEAFRIGAHDYLVKPVRMEVLLKKVEFLLGHQAAMSENKFLRRAAEGELPPGGLVGVSAATDRVRQLVGKLAGTDSTVLILGETGTGKELVARAMHHMGPRANEPFVAINCGSIPETLLESELFGHERGAFTGAERDKKGLFEVAGRGTIFLDEIGEMPMSIQGKLLRVVESREVTRVGSTVPTRIKGRLVAATHRDLGEMVKEGKFRADLFYRLNVVEIGIRPLRERPEDVPPIAEYLLKRICRNLNRSVPKLEEDALEALVEYRWPGNVRELANVLERALILSEGGTITLSDLPGFVAAGERGVGDDLRSARRAFERAHVHRVLDKFRGDKQRAAEALGISLSVLYEKLGR